MIDISVICRGEVCIVCEIFQCCRRRVIWCDDIQCVVGGSVYVCDDISGVGGG